VGQQPFKKSASGMWPSIQQTNDHRATRSIDLRWNHISREWQKSAYITLKTVTSTASENWSVADSDPEQSLTLRVKKDPARASEVNDSHSDPRKTSMAAGPVEDFKREVASETRSADSDTNIHWPTYSGPNSPLRSPMVRRTSSLAMNMSDSIIEFRDEDGSYVSVCDHNNVQQDHRCGCWQSASRD
jgi:hypothetical protein